MYTNLQLSPSFVYTLRCRIAVLSALFPGEVSYLHLRLSPAKKNPHKINYNEIMSRVTFQLGVNGEFHVLSMHSVLFIEFIFVV